MLVSKNECSPLDRRIKNKNLTTKGEYFYVKKSLYSGSFGNGLLYVKEQRTMGVWITCHNGKTIKFSCFIHMWINVVILILLEVWYSIKL